MKLRIPDRLFREGQATLADDQKTLRLSASSEEPCLRWGFIDDELTDYYEVLDHSKGGLDDTRLRARASLLFNHHADVQLGSVVNPSIENKRLYVDASLTEAKDVEDHCLRIKEGHLRHTSVGYVVSEDCEQIGEKDGIPVLRFAWEPHEVSMVTIPADRTVGAGRSRELIRKEEAEATKAWRQISVRNTVDVIPVNKQKAESEMKPNDLSAPRILRETPTERPGATRTPEDIAREEQNINLRIEQAATEKLRKEIARQRDIAAIAKKFSIDEKVTQQFLDDDKRSVDQFNAEVLKIVAERGADTPRVTVVGERQRPVIEGVSGSLGHRFVNTKDFKERAGQLGRKRSIEMSVDYPMLGARGHCEMLSRAGFNSPDVSAVNVAPQMGILALGVQDMTILDLLAPGTTSAAAIPYVRENTFTPAAETVGERGVKPNWDPDLETETANVKKVAVTTKVPDEFMSDITGVQSYIDNRLPYMVDLETEDQVLYGDGLGNNLRGILSTSGVQTRAYATSWALSIRKAITDVEVNAQFKADGIAMHPYDWEVAQLETDLEGRFIAGGPVTRDIGGGAYARAMTYWGLPVVPTTSVTVGRPVVGAWRTGAQYFVREGMRIETTNSNEDDFRRNLICIRAEHRLALAVYRPVAFIEITGGPARS